MSLLTFSLLTSSALALPFHLTDLISHKQPGAPWGLARISHPNYAFSPDGNTFFSNDNNAYYYYDALYPVTVYMLDTGVDVSHPEFQGRASWGANFVDSIDDDDNGHGTHLSGIAIGGTMGVARNASLVAVKILNSQRYGSIANMVNAVDWVINDAKTRQGKAVINYSALGSISSEREQAITRAVDNGIFVVNAAGNDGEDACAFGPANMGNAYQGVIVTAALNYTNVPATFSNGGPCVGVWAPGVNIHSSLPNGGYGYMDGTSNAAAFVSGLVAYLWGQDPTISIDNMTSIIKAANTGAMLANYVDTTGSVVYNYYFS